MTTTTPTTPVGTTDSPARSSRGRAAVVAAVGVLAGAGIATAVVLGMGIGPRSNRRRLRCRPHTPRPSSRTGRPRSRRAG